MLSIENLYATDEQLGSEWLLQRLKKSSEKNKPMKKHALFFSVLDSLKLPIILAIFPRLCLIGFKFAQPFLINRVIDFVGQSDTPESKNIGYGLIGATALIYIGLSASSPPPVVKFVVLIIVLVVSTRYPKHSISTWSFGP